MRVKKNLLLFILASLLFGGFIFSERYLYKEEGFALSDWEYTSEQSGTKSVEVPKYLPVFIGEFYDLKTTFSTDSLSSQSLYDCFVIPRMNGYSFQVYMNDYLLYQMGDMTNPTANHWAYAHRIAIPEYAYKGINEIRIRVYADHDVGFVIKPYLAQYDKVNLRIELINLLGTNFNYIVIGLSFAFGILTILISAYMDIHRKVIRITGIASLLFGVYNFEFITRMSTGTLTQLFIIRKLLILSLVVALFMLLFIMVELLWEKEVCKYAAITSLVGIPILFVPNSMILYKINNIYNIIFMVVMFGIIISNFFTKKREFVFSLTFCLLTIFQALYVFTFKIPATVYFHFGVLFLQISIQLSIVNRLLLIFNENTYLHKKSCTDQLTQAYNRNFFETYAESKEDIFVYIDLDRFKAYNDTFGHEEGDQLLKDFVSIVKQHLLLKEQIVRYGGDEFILIFCSNNEAILTERIEKIREKFISKYPSVNFSYGISRLEKNLFDTLRDADENMYLMKKGKVNL